MEKGIRIFRPQVDVTELIRYLTQRETSTSQTIIAGRRTILGTSDVPEEEVRVLDEGQMVEVIYDGTIASAMRILELAGMRVDRSGIIGPVHTVRNVVEALQFPLFGCLGYKGMFRKGDRRLESARSSVDWRDVPRAFERLATVVMNGFVKPRRVHPVTVAALLEHEYRRLAPHPFASERMARCLAVWVLLVSDYGRLPVLKDWSRYEEAIRQPNRHDFARWLRECPDVRWEQYWVPHKFEAEGGGDEE